MLEPALYCDKSTNAANTSWVNSKLSTLNNVTGNLTATGNIISQNSFICTGYAELVAGNNTANKLELTSAGVLNIYSSNNKTLSVSSTGGTINGSTIATQDWVNSVVTGATGSFTSPDGKTVTITNGLITSIA